MSVSQARKRAAKLLRQIAQGGDPHADKIKQRQRTRLGLDRAETVGAAWDRYLRQHVRRNLKPTTQKEVERLGRKFILPALGALELKTLEAHHAKALIGRTIEHAPITANRLLTTLKAFAAWSRSELLIERNPFAGLAKPTIESARDRILSPKEIRWFWIACDRIGGPYGAVLKALLLTGQRKAEVAGMHIDELDFTARTWTLEGSRTKNRRRHVVFITDQLEKVIRSSKWSDRFVFGVNGKPPGAWSQAKARVDEIMAEFALNEEFENLRPWIIHDLRRTCASGKAELGVQVVVIERVLNHVSGQLRGVVGIYQRHQFEPEMQAAWIAWADHVTAAILG